MTGFQSFEEIFCTHECFFCKEYGDNLRKSRIFVTKHG